VSIVELLLIALGLSMDAFAVAVATGAIMGKTTGKLHLGLALRMAAFFGGFQALMPIVGWLAGMGLRDYISAFDHWIAFGLLLFIGMKMVYEGMHLDEDGEKDSADHSLLVLLGLSIATSIDALAVGLSFSMLGVAIPVPALIIGVCTFSLTFAGVGIGAKVGHFFEKKIEIMGGLILIGIGAKILVDHL